MVGLVVYRLYFHPLAEYPGPLLARITSFDAAWHAWKGDSHMVLYHAHRKYGKLSSSLSILLHHSSRRAHVPFHLLEFGVPSENIRLEVLGRFMPVIKVVPWAAVRSQRRSLPGLPGSDRGVFCA